ncbi:hypothetical protein LARI1_G009468 [Lachnellula arida]|uniref:F-box domain-containing protein n=1 Tax=Lachnellula arida TaxID=1316785 RepID=A0A8T9B0T6_9HELO|nr:hypothetical protein LARI1_G009468 [Lachnellula arida]
MTHNCCTALIRYVAEDSRPPRPRNQPRLGFLSLPREIRDKIYDIALVSNSSIIVCKGKWQTYTLPQLGEGPRPWPWDRIRWRAIDHDASTASLRSLNLKLLFCNKVIAHEAAMIFYHRNTFSFLGDHNWDPIVLWLETVGAENRNSLVSIGIEGKRPDRVWQRPNGERVRHPGAFTTEEIYPRHPLLRTGEGSFKYGSVDNINPAIENIFVLLGSRVSEKSVTIVMLFACPWPGAGANPRPDDCSPECGWNSMELPNLIDGFRTLHTQVSGLQDSVDVLWKGRNSRWAFQEDRPSMEKLGWQVTELGAEEPDFLLWPWDDRSDTSPNGIVLYVLRRDKPTGPLLAQDPSPFSYIWASGMDEE